MKAAVLQLLRVAECSLSSDGERIPHGKSLFFFVATPSSRAQPFLPKPCNEGSQARAIFFFQRSEQRCCYQPVADGCELHRAKVQESSGKGLKVDTARVPCPDGSGTFGRLLQRKSSVLLKRGAALRLASLTARSQPGGAFLQPGGARGRAEAKRLLSPHLAAPELGGQSTSWQQELSPTSL